MKFNKIALLAALSLLPFSLQAEEKMLSLSFTPTTATSNSAIGVGYYKFREEGYGFYMNTQLTLEFRQPHYESLNMGSFGDPVTDQYKDLFVINVGALKSFNDHLSAYGGIGYARVSGIGQKYDSFRILSDDGYYYVDDPANSSSGVNLNIGAIATFNHLALEFGYNSFTKVSYTGIGLKY